MNKQTLVFVIFLGFLTVLMGFNYFIRPFEGIAEQFSSPQVADNFNVIETPSPEEQIFSALSSKEKLAQLIALPVNLSEESASSSAWIEKNKPGFITVFGSNISLSQVRGLEEKLQTGSDSLDIYLAVDHEGGSVQRLKGEGFAQLPSWELICKMNSLESRDRLLTQSANELSNAGIDIVFAPVVDIGNNPILKSRICSDDATLVADRATEFISAFANQDILPVLKHFPGIGKTKKDLHHQFDSVAIEVEDALIYQSLLNKFPFLGVMVAHVGVKNQFENIPCSLSKSCVGELSNNYSQSLIFSDALDMKSALFNRSNQEKTIEQVSIEAIEAGVDILVYGQELQLEKFDSIIESLLLEYNSSPDFKEKVDSSARKIISYKLEKKL